GQNRFYAFCAPCHNYGGTGDGLVHKRAPEFGATETMNLTRDVARTYTDAKIFHIISVGQNIMPAYGDRISETDRWAIIHFVRELQAKAAARESAGGASTAMDNTTTQSAKGKQ
ncbi:MAG: c-type cytochrome, partial [Candidatus Kapaibacterium sp.]